MTTNQLHRELNEWRARALTAEAQLRDRTPLTAADGTPEPPLPNAIPED